MKNLKSEENIIITINAIKKVMVLFLGPFLTAYFIKTSKESIIDLSSYYIFSYIMLAICSFIVASIIKRKFRIGMFRVGVILNFFYVMLIIILKEKIINYLPILSIVYGISSSTYWFSYNLFVINKIDNNNRTEFTVKSKIISSIIGILCPILLGSIITITDYELTAIIILVISFIQIILSFLLNPENNNSLSKFNLLKTLKIIKNNKQIRKISIVEFFIGMNVSDGALEILITILIFNSFKTNMNLGIITTIATILSMIFVKLYGKIYKNRNDKNIIIISGIIPVISVLILMLCKNSFTIITYNFCYVIFTSILTLAREIRLFNISDSSIIDKDNQCEFFSLRECILNLGRIFGYILLLIAGLSMNQYILNITMLLLTSSILITAFNVKDIKKYEN